MDMTQRLSLPMIIPGQAQKELFHNEALLLLDAIVAGAVEDEARNDPPDPPAPGSCYLIGDNPVGEWAPYPRHLAVFATGGWRFVAPVAGLAVMIKSSGSTARYGETGWEVGTVRALRLMIDGRQVIGPQLGPIDDAAGGATVDLEARGALSAVLAALRQHGLISA